MRRHLGHFGITLVSLWGYVSYTRATLCHFGITVGHFGITLGSHWITLGALQARLGLLSEAVWAHDGGFGTRRGHFWKTLLSLLAYEGDFESFRVAFCYPLGTL